MNYTHNWQLPFGVDLISLVRLFCWFSIAVIVAARLIPASRTRFLSYGARVHQFPPSHNQGRSDDWRSASSSLDKLASFDVPHSWFTHFYVLSLSLSLFWLVVTVSQHTVLRVVTTAVSPRRPTTSAPASWLCIVLMLMQSTRRLKESVKFASGSKSRMWIGHYLFGLAFYFFANLAVWIEGVHEILAWRTKVAIPPSEGISLRTCLGVTVFLLASYLQHLAHAHLVSLPKYSVPQHWLFRVVIAPHYTAECVIYLALASIAAPDQRLFNGSLLCIGLLTTVNLGITAHDTKVWMLSKFRESEGELDAKYCMLPGVW